MEHECKNLDNQHTNPRNHALDYVPTYFHILEPLSVPSFPMRQIFFREGIRWLYIYTRRNDTTWNILSPSFPIIRNIPTLGLGNLRYFFKSQTITTVYPMATSQQKFKATGVFLTRNVQGIASRNWPSMRGPRALMFEASWDDGCWVPKKYRGDKYPQAT